MRGPPTKGKTRKRTPEEQTLWDEIEAMRAARLALASHKAELLSELEQTPEDWDKEAVLGRVAAVRANRLGIERIDREISEKLDRYKKLRESAE